MYITSVTFVRGCYSLTSHNTDCFLIAPYVPPIDPSNASDTQNFDDTFLDMEPVINDENDEQTDTDQQTDNDRTDGEDSVATPSQSRSPSIHPEEDGVDVFDGYSFKGRHSVILDDDEEEGDDEEDEEEEEDSESLANGASLNELLQQQSETTVEIIPNEITTVDEVPEPTTPEAVQPKELPEAEEVPATTEVQTPEDEKPTDTPVVAAPPQPIAPSTPSKASEEASPIVEPRPVAVPAKQETIIVKAPIPRAPAKGRNRREKSGIPALDRNIAEEEGTVTERDEDDDDWDFVETNVNEERNGSKGTSLFARGVVDRYRLAVFRKSTPRRPDGRRVSAVSAESDSQDPQSPTPSDKHRRGRNPGLTFRRNPKEFLRAKSPPPSQSSGKSRLHPSASTISATSATSTNMLTPSPSMSSTLPNSPSLKSKESAISMGSPSSSSDQSLNGDTSRATSVIDGEKQKSKGLKKYKEGAEKVLSIFQSPR